MYTGFSIRISKENDTLSSSLNKLGCVKSCKRFSKTW